MTAPPQDLPDVATLSQRQQRGMDCCLCGITLTASTAVDLGPREVKILDYVTRWFPRACRTHNSEESHPCR